MMMMMTSIPQSTKAANVSKAFHRYALNYINALNYLETLRRQQEFSDFEKVTHSFVSFLSVFDRVPAGAKGPKPA